MECEPKVCKVESQEHLLGDMLVPSKDFVWVVLLILCCEKTHS